MSLTVTDDNGVDHRHAIDIDVQPIPNVAPVAVGEPDHREQLEGTAIQFTGDQSSDPDNTPGGLTYLWDFGDGGTSTLANPSHVFATRRGQTRSSRSRTRPTAPTRSSCP